jgi:hypothetical protein
VVCIIATIVLPELLHRTSLVKIEDDRREVRPVSRHSTLRRYFILVGSHRTADQESKVTAQTTTKSVNQAHFGPGSHFGEEQLESLASAIIEKLFGSPLDIYLTRASIFIDRGRSDACNPSPTGSEQ